MKPLAVNAKALLRIRELGRSFIFLSRQHLRKEIKMENDEWKYIPGYEGLYLINRNGVVKSVPKIGRPEKLIKQLITENGYLRVSLCKNSKSKQKRIHRILATIFIPNPENKAFVNHINGDKLDNRIENLEWCTNSENMKHAHETGLKKPPNGVSSPIYQMDMNDNIICEYPSIKSASNNMGRTNREICRALKGIVKYAHGFKWKYKNN